MWALSFLNVSCNGIQLYCPRCTLGEKHLFEKRKCMDSEACWSNYLQKSSLLKLLPNAAYIDLDCREGRRHNLAFPVFIFLWQYSEGLGLLSPWKLRVLPDIARVCSKQTQEPINPGLKRFTLVPDISYKMLIKMY